MTPDDASASTETAVRAHAADAGGPHTLAIDIGGSHIKATVLDREAGLSAELVRVVTPVGEPPESIVAAIADLVAPLPAYDRICAGFPGVVRQGVVLTAPNLDHDGWQRFDLAAALRARLGKPTRVLNDADLQGLGAVHGQGLEMIVTLGTGFGTGLFLDGRALPHLEIAHHEFKKGKTYDERLGNAARKRVGHKKWRKRVKQAIANMRALTAFDHLYVGGGNAKRLDFEPDPDVTILENDAAFQGAVRAWRD